MFRVQTREKEKYVKELNYELYLKIIKMYGWVQRARRNFMEVQQADTQQKLNVCL